MLWFVKTIYVGVDIQILIFYLFTLIDEFLVDKLFLEKTTNPQ
jgi:hypothetical protein